MAQRRRRGMQHRRTHERERQRGAIEQQLEPLADSPLHSASPPPPPQQPPLPPQPSSPLWISCDLCREEHCCSAERAYALKRATGRVSRGSAECASIVSLMRVQWNGGRGGGGSGARAGVQSRTDPRTPRPRPRRMGRILLLLLRHGAPPPPLVNATAQLQRDTQPPSLVWRHRPPAVRRGSRGGRNGAFAQGSERGDGECERVGVGPAARDAVARRRRDREEAQRTRRSACAMRPWTA